MKDVYLVKNLADDFYYSPGNTWRFAKERAIQFDEATARRTAERLQSSTVNPNSKFVAVLWKYNEAPAGMGYELKEPGHNCRCASSYGVQCVKPECPRIYNKA